MIDSCWNFLKTTALPELSRISELVRGLLVTGLFWVQSQTSWKIFSSTLATFFDARTYPKSAENNEGEACPFKKWLVANWSDDQLSFHDKLLSGWPGPPGGLRACPPGAN
jgi:hypothetical protein